MCHATPYPEAYTTVVETKQARSQHVYRHVEPVTRFTVTTRETVKWRSAGAPRAWAKPPSSSAGSTDSFISQHYAEPSKHT